VFENTPRLSCEAKYLSANFKRTDIVFVCLSREAKYLSANFKRTDCDTVFVSQIVYPV